MKNKRIIIFIVHCSLLIAHCSLLSALDFNIRPKGYAFIANNDLFDTGGGGEIGFEADISSILPNPLAIGYTLGVEGGMTLNSLQGAPTNVFFYSGGGVIGLYYFPLSRLFLRGDMALGAYMSSMENVTSKSGAFWRYGGEAGFRFTPEFTLAGTLGLRNYAKEGGSLFSSPVNSGMYAGVTAQLTFRAGSGGISDGVGARLDSDDPMYPLLMQLYQNIPAAYIILTNNENAEIRNVRIFFRAQGYTASQFLCDEKLVIAKGRSVEIPLLADFSENIMRFTDSGRLMGELVIRYRFLGKEREVIRALTVPTHNRNAYPEGDTEALCAFVSSSSVEVLEFARYIASLERSNRRQGHVMNTQYAIWLLEGMRASGIRIGETNVNENEAQHPAETLAFRTGSPTDLVLLYASALESVGIKSALIQTETDLFVAACLGNQGAAGVINNRDRTLIVNGEVWLPLSMRHMGEGFNIAWTRASTTLNRLFAEKKQADFVIVQDAWLNYPPALMPELGRPNLRTDTNAALANFARALDQAR